MTQHTPGPWEWVANGSLEEDAEEGGFKDKYASLQLVPTNAERKHGRYRYDDCIVAFYVDHYQESEWKTPGDANARLIAAAPELLEALRDLADSVADCPPGAIPITLAMARAGSVLAEAT